MILKDVDGLDVYLSGEQMAATYDALKNSMPNLGLTMDETGKLYYSGEAQNSQQEEFINAMTSPNINVNLITTEGHYIEGEPFVVGAYHGSIIENGKTETVQFFNINDAKVWQKAGGSEVGKSALHEIIESYIGGKLFPGQFGYNKDNYKKAHKETKKFEKPKEYYPKIRHYYATVNGGKKHSKATLYNAKRDKEYIVYENK